MDLGGDEGIKGGEAVCDALLLGLAWAAQSDSREVIKVESQAILRETA